MELIGGISYTGHVVRCILSLKSTDAIFIWRNNRKTSGYRTCPYWRSGSSVIRYYTSG